MLPWLMPLVFLVVMLGLVLLCFVVLRHVSLEQAVTALGEAKNEGLGITHGRGRDQYGGSFGGGRLGDRNYSNHSHVAASAVGGPEHGSATYRAHPSQKGEDVDDALAASLGGTGFNDHHAFGAEHQGQYAQGIEHGGPHIDPDPEPGRRS